MTTETNTENTPASTDEAASAEQLRESIRAELKAELEREQAVFNDLLTAEIKNAPPHLARLIPESLPLIEQVKWLRKAAESGASFATTVPATDARRPSNTPPVIDTAGLSPIARIAAGYSK